MMQAELSGAPMRANSTHRLLVTFFLVCWLMACSAPAVAPSCEGAAISFTPDYRYVIGGARFSSASKPETGSLYRWLTEGASLAAGPVAEQLPPHIKDRVRMRPVPGQRAKSLPPGG